MGALQFDLNSNANLFHQHFFTKMSDTTHYIIYIVQQDIKAKPDV